MYRALYRKWRPQIFSDVYGQSHITETLCNEISSGRLSHAYLFTGSRGTGKTTCAKILAKAVNCLDPHNGNPCNECAICRGIDDGSILDVTEIDAASNNGVDNIRDLRDEVNFTPAAAKYRVYIIDEVHMLSLGAFNALLKTLEEPPEHVLFILATTEVHKLPATILSRCQRFDFRRIPPEDIAARLKVVAENEKLTLDEEAAMLIARISDGALRDALSILDQCGGYNEPITTAVVSKAAGLLGRDYLFEISDAVLNENGNELLNIIDRLHSSSCDMERLMSELVGHYRNIMMAKTVREPAKFVVCTPEELERYKKCAAGMTYGSILHIIETLCRESAQLKYVSNQRAQTEAVLIRLCNLALSADTEALVRRIDDLQAEIMRLKATGVTVKATPAQYEAPKPAEVKPAAQATVEAPEKKIAEQPAPVAEEIPEAVAEAAEIPDAPLDETTPDEAPFGDEPPQEPEYAPLFGIEEPAEEPAPAEISTDQAADEQPKMTAVTHESAKRVDTAVVTESDKAVPFAAWENTLNQLSKINRPFYPMVLGSTAYRAGNTVFIKPKNTAFAQMFSQKIHSDSIAEALMRATGEQLKPMLYTDGKSPAANDGVSPVDSLLMKLDKNNIDYLIEE